MTFSMTLQENGDCLKTGDCLIEVTAWAGLTVYWKVWRYQSDKSEAINWRIDKTMATRQIMIYKTLHRKLKIEQHNHRFKVKVMMFNDTLNNISVISWQSVLLVEKTTSRL
jgi:hypothetical protein